MVPLSLVAVVSVEIVIVDCVDNSLVAAFKKSLKLIPLSNDKSIAYLPIAVCCWAHECHNSVCADTNWSRDHKLYHAADVQHSLTCDRSTIDTFHCRDCWFPMRTFDIEFLRQNIIHDKRSTNLCLMCETFALVESLLRYKCEQNILRIREEQKPNRTMIKMQLNIINKRQNEQMIKKN